MGCGASTAGAAGGAGSPLIKERPLAEGIPLEDWDCEDVSSWFSRLPATLHRYRSVLLPDEGVVLVRWTEQYLKDKGVTAADTVRLLAYRDKALAKGFVARGPAAAVHPLSAPPQPQASKTADLMSFALSAAPAATPSPDAKALAYAATTPGPPSLPAVQELQSQAPIPLQQQPPDPLPPPPLPAPAPPPRLPPPPPPPLSQPPASSTPPPPAGAQTQATAMGFPVAAAAKAEPAGAPSAAAARDLARVECKGGEVPGKEGKGKGKGGEPPLCGIKDQVAEIYEEDKKVSLGTLLTKGIRFARVAIAKIGPSLPFPGAEAANLLIVVLDLVDTAVANHANLAALRERAVAFLDILTAYAAELARCRHYKGVVDDFKELLEGISAYARNYAQRNCITRMLTSNSDAGHYEKLSAAIGDLAERVMMLVSADTNARLQGVAAAVEESTALLQRVAAYQDPAADARALVEELGGLEAVIAAPDKMQAVVGKLDIGSRCTIEAVSMLLESHLDNGPQRHIRQPELRLFWKAQFAGESEVPWYVWWDAFPEELRAAAVEAGAVDALRAMLGGDGARRTFQRALERGKADAISVWEIRMSFVGEESLLSQISRLLSISSQQPGDGMSGRPGRQDGAGGPAATAPPAASGGAQTASAAAGRSPCQLPELVAQYTGREEEAQALVEVMVTRGSLLLVAPGGMGKSCLATDVGWRLVRGGWTPGGALWVDLREAVSKAELEARFCAALGLQPEKSDNVAKIVAALNQVVEAASASPVPAGGAGAGAAGQAVGAQGAGGEGPSAAPPMRALVVVDNLEDALLQEETAVAARELIAAVLADAPAARLLLTSRAPLDLAPPPRPGLPLPAPPDGQSPGQRPPSPPPPPPPPQLHCRHVGAISPAAAAALVRETAEDLSEAEAAAVAAACQCVPLVLCLVAEALVAGRLTVEDLPRLTASQHAPGAAGPVDPTGGTVRLVLSGLKRHLQLAAASLSVFPSAFDPEAAAAVLGVSQPQAQSVLEALYRHSVLLRAGSTQHQMHMMVRQQAGALGSALDAGLAGRAEGRYVGHVMHLLTECSTMYRRAKETRLALTVAREHQPDIGKLLELLAAAPPAGGGPARSGCAESWRPEVVGEALSDGLRMLFEGLGLIHRLAKPCAALLERLEQPVLAEGGAPAGAGAAAREAERQRAEAAVLNILSSIKMRTGQYKAGEAVARRSWELRCAALGEEHPETATSLNNLATCISAQGRAAEAEPLYRRALELRQRGPQPDDVDVASSLNGLASSINSQGRFAEAEPRYRESLELRARSLGSEHPSTAASIENLAGCIKAQKRYDEAAALYQQALDLRRRVQGDEHPSTAGALNGLAACTYGAGRYAEAEPLFVAALELRRRVYGNDHPSTISSVNGLAHCISAQGRTVDAEMLYMQAEEAAARTLGPDHPTTKLYKSRAVPLVPW